MAVQNACAAVGSIEELLGKLEPEIGKVFSQFKIPTQEAEDLLQEALLALVVKRERIQEPARWLLGALRTQCLIYWRRRRRKLYETVDTTLLEMAAEPVPAGGERAHWRCDLNRAISGLSHRCKSILRLRYGLGFEGDEVASRLGYQPSSIRRVTLRCLSYLTRRLTGDAPVPEVEP